MNEIFMLELSDVAMQDIKSVAFHIGQSIEKVLIEWINDNTANLQVKYLPDSTLQMLAKSQPEQEYQHQLEKLLSMGRGSLSDNEHNQLRGLISKYQQALERKIQAVETLAERNLPSCLD